MPLPLARLSSNKENTFPRHPLATRKAKAGVLGLGIGKGLPSRRSVKRSASVQRAKAKAANSKPSKAAAAARNPAPPSSTTSAPTPAPAAPSAGYVKIPRTLARPLLPSVAELDLGGALVVS